MMTSTIVFRDKTVGIYNDRRGDILDRHINPVRCYDVDLITESSKARLAMLSYCKNTSTHVRFQDVSHELVSVMTWRR